MRMRMRMRMGRDRVGGIRRRASVVSDTNVSSCERKRWRRRGKTRGEEVGHVEEVAAASSSPRVYRECELYELAFSYRNVETEVEYLLSQYQRWAAVSTSEPKNEIMPSCILELGAGPAAHAIETARQLAHTASAARLEQSVVHCLDIEPCMRALGLKRAAQARVSLEYHIANMRAFNLSTGTQGRVELAFCLLGSLAHLETVNDLMGFFASVHAVMRPGGVLVLELEHPSNFLFCDQGDSEYRQSGGESWYIEEEENDSTSPTSRGLSETEVAPRKRLGVSWGSAQDEVDPVAGIRRRTIGFTLFGETTRAHEDGKDIDGEDGNGEAQSEQIQGRDAYGGERGRGGRNVIDHWEEVVNARAITVPELELLATKCSGFDIVEMHGEMESSMDVPVDVEDAYRLVVTLRKRR